MSDPNSSFSVNYTRCMQAHTAIDRVAGDLVSLLSELESDAQPLVATWEGPAQQAYFAKQKRWQEDSAEITRILQAINRALEESMAGYKNADRYGVSLFTE